MAKPQPSRPFNQGEERGGSNRLCRNVANKYSRESKFTSLWLISVLDITCHKKNQTFNQPLSRKSPMPEDSYFAESFVEQRACGSPHSDYWVFRKPIESGRDSKLKTMYTNWGCSLRTSFQMKYSEIQINPFGSSTVDLIECFLTNLIYMNLQYSVLRESNLFWSDVFWSRSSYPPIYLYLNLYRFDSFRLPILLHLHLHHSLYVYGPRQRKVIRRKARTLLGQNRGFMQIIVVYSCYAIVVNNG